MPPKLESKGINLNTLILVIAIIGASWSAVKIGGPLVNLPENVGAEIKDVRESVDDVAQQTANIERTQAVQTEALKTLADVAKDSRETRRDVDRHTAELDSVKRRLDRLEAR